MATIPQRELFTWKEIKNLGDLERLQLVLEYLPDERLMQRLEAERGQGRDDWPVRAVWNSILSGVVCQHASVESLRRELARNPQLRWLCGFDITKTEKLVPPANTYTRFLKKLMELSGEVEAIFDDLVKQLREELPGFGEILAMDGKAVRSVARRAPDRQKAHDRRRDLDADRGVKTYWIKDGKNGNPWKKVKSWFGYKLHLIVDANYELPVAFESSWMKTDGCSPLWRAAVTSGKTYTRSAPL